MRLAGARILVTGASSGIGRGTAIALASRGARVALQGRDERRLEETRFAIRARGGGAEVIAADLSVPGSAEECVAAAAAALGRLDAVVNVAGRAPFLPFEAEDPDDAEDTFRVNVFAPMRVARAALPHLRRAGGGRIVNVGSIFGSIAFPWFTTYSASKFALRGFSEALRRELRGSGIGVTYVAPRATRTPLARAFERMAAAVRMPMDDPEDVGRRVADALERDADDRYLGFPESLFVRLNAVLPRLVDRALRSQSERMRPFAEERVPRTAARAAIPSPVPAGGRGQPVPERCRP